MVYGPRFNQQSPYGLAPVDKDKSDDQQDNSKKKRVLYQGRAWKESEEDLPVQPSAQQTPPSNNKRSLPSAFVDRKYQDHAQNLLKGLTTIEEKVAQLFFLETEAIYDADLQRNVELLIQAWQIGGILFRKGEYKRQAYLIETYQQLTKTKLLIANDFMHGLSFYLQGNAFSREEISERKISDLGKAVMVQNRRLGVHIQFDQERGKDETPMEEPQVKAFRNGVRQALGVVGKDRIEKLAGSVEGSKSPLPFVKMKEDFSNSANIQETIGYKTVLFFDGTKIKDSLEEELLQAFKNQYDVFLFGKNLPEAMLVLCRLVRTGRITEEELDRRITKLLIIKSFV